ncbi:hypothetical protein J3458_001204 [Metarhizium acridum]|uniref:uncharacterized protein n=1 Tax=Metarhizium acridum TaxID=92637 RepID=UPI001C6AFF00|nr:hypothetical protein J3458_001204 [Metarhizium acridum]
MAQPDLPTSMRTVRQLDKLAPELALVRTQVPVPSQPTDVLVKVAATALCYGELTCVIQNLDLLMVPKYQRRQTDSNHSLDITKVFERVMAISQENRLISPCHFDLVALTTYVGHVAHMPVQLPGLCNHPRPPRS